MLPSLTARGGGIELYLRQLIGGVARLWPRAALHALLAREGQLAHPELLEPDVQRRLRVLGCGATWRPARLAELAVRLGQAAFVARPDLVVCGHLNHAAPSSAIARLWGAPLVTVAHGIEVWNVRSPIDAAALRRSDLVLAVSSVTGGRIVASAGVDPSRVAVLNNAVDPSRFRPGAPSATTERKLAHLPHPRLLTVARLDADEGYKGVDQVIRALAKRPIAGSYLVVGTGSDVPRLRALAWELGVPVELYGHATDEELPDLFRACDLFVMPSRGEGFGFVFIEALASGLPVIAGAVDGSVDALGGGELGLLVDPRDVDAIAAAIDAHLTGRSPAEVRDPARLRAEATRRFGPAAFQDRVDRAFARLA